jgi:hypothetical protein
MRRRSTILWSIVLVMVGYLLAYLWVRQGHYLVHRLTWAGGERYHAITTGDYGPMNEEWWVTVTHTVPYWCFAPVRWIEAHWWTWRDGHAELTRPDA